MFMKNCPAQLHLTQNECACVPCLIPANCHSLAPLPRPPQAPDILKRGNEGWFYDHRLMSSQLLLLLVICMKG